jgi:hypothetical protein
MPHRLAAPLLAASGAALFAFGAAGLPMIDVDHRAVSAQTPQQSQHHQLVRFVDTTRAPCRHRLRSHSQEF